MQGNHQRAGRSAGLAASLLAQDEQGEGFFFRLGTQVAAALDHGDEFGQLLQGSQTGTHGEQGLAVPETTLQQPLDQLHAGSIFILPGCGSDLPVRQDVKLIWKLGNLLGSQLAYLLVFLLLEQGV